MHDGIPQTHISAETVEPVIPPSQRLLSLEGHPLLFWKNDNDQIIVAYWDCDIKGYGVLIGESGCGYTFEEACQDYIRKISGKTLVFHACTKSREEVKVMF